MNLEPAGTLGMAHLFWNEVPGALRYDVIQGDLDQVTAQPGMLSLGPVRVLASGITGTTFTESAIARTGSSRRSRGSSSPGDHPK